MPLIIHVFRYSLYFYLNRVTSPFKFIIFKISLICIQIVISVICVRSVIVLSLAWYTIVGANDRQWV